MPIENLFTPSGRRHRPQTGIVRGGGGMVGTGGGMSQGSSPTAMLNTFLGLMDRAVNYSREQSLETNAREFAKNVLNLNPTETERFIHPDNLGYAQQLMNKFLERSESKKINKKNAQVLQKLFPSLQGNSPPPSLEEGANSVADFIKPSETEFLKNLPSTNTDEGNNEQSTSPLNNLLSTGVKRPSDQTDEEFYKDFPIGEDTSASELTARLDGQKDLPSNDDLAAGVAEITRENQDVLGIETIDEGLERKNREEIGATMSQSAKEQNKPHKETSVMRATEKVLQGNRSIVPSPESIDGLSTSEIVEKSIGDQLFHDIFKENVNKLGLDHPLLTGLMELNIDELTDLYGTETGQSLIKSVYTQYFNTLNNNYKTRLTLGEQFQSNAQKQAREKLVYLQARKLEMQKRKHKFEFLKQKSRLEQNVDTQQKFLAQTIEQDNVIARLKAEVQSKKDNLELFENKDNTILRDNETGDLSVLSVGKNTGDISVTKVPGTKGLNKLPLPLKLSAGTTPTKSVLSEIQKKVDVAASLTTELSELKTYLVSDDGKTSLTYFDKSARGMLQKLGSFKFGIMALDALGKNELTRNFTQEQIKELRRFEKFSQNAQNQFIRFRKFITGVAGGEFEMGEIKKAFFNLEEDDWFTLTAKIDGLLELQQRIYTGAVAILKDNTIGGKAQTAQLNQLVEQSLAKSGYTWDTFYVKRKDNSKVMNDNLKALKNLLENDKGIR